MPAPPAGITTPEMQPVTTPADREDVQSIRAPPRPARSTQPPTRVRSPPSGTVWLPPRVPPVRQSVGSPAGPRPSPCRSRSRSRTPPHARHPAAEPEAGGQTHRRTPSPHRGTRDTLSAATSRPHAAGSVYGAQGLDSGRRPPPHGHQYATPVTPSGFAINPTRSSRYALTHNNP